MRGGVPTREIHHAKADRDVSVAGLDRYFGGDCANGWFGKFIRTTSSIDEPGQPIAAGTSRPPPTAGRAVPDEKNLGDPNDPINRENAALDRMTKGICRGC
jgi:hypothetical protein